MYTNIGPPSYRVMQLYAPLEIANFKNYFKLDATGSVYCFSDIAFVEVQS